MTALTCDFTSQLVPTAPPPAIGYVRLSLLAGDRNRSKQGMVEDLYKAAKQYGYHLERVLIDDGYSGAIRNRPEFLEWLAEGRRGKALLTWHTDRLTREGINVAGLILDVVEGKDSITGKVTGQPVRYLDCFGTDSENEAAFRFKFAIDAEVARQERTRIQARNLAAQRRLREAHVYRGGAVPFGYRVVPHPSGRGKGLEINPDEAAAIRLATDHVLGGGSLYGALKLWQAAGIKPKRAKEWSLSSVRAILTGHPVLGRQCHKGVPVRDEKGEPVTPWEPILTLEEVEALRAAAAGNKNPWEGNAPRKRATRLLSGLLRCATCDGPLRVQHTGKYVKYNCNGGYQGRGCTRPVNISAPSLEEHVEREFLNRFGHIEAFERRVTALREASESNTVEAEIQETSRAMAEPRANIPELAERMVALQARRAELESTPQAVEQIVQLGHTIAEEWTDSDVATRRNWLKWGVEGQPIVVKPSAVRGRHIFDSARAEIPWREKWESWMALRDKSATR